MLRTILPVILVVGSYQERIEPSFRHQAGAKKFSLQAALSFQSLLLDESMKKR
jgi:hypothetical protein